MKVAHFVTLGGGVVLAALLSAPSSGDICKFGSDNHAIVAPYPAVAKPPYRFAFPETTYRGYMQRIANDYNSSCGDITCTWQTDTRHRYSKDQPWSAGGDVLAILNNNGTPHARLYLNGYTYALLNYTDHTNPPLHYTDWRWHPTLSYVQIIMDAQANTVYWVDVRYRDNPPIKQWSFGDLLRISVLTPVSVRHFSVDTYPRGGADGTDREEVGWTAHLHAGVQASASRAGATG